LKLAHERGRLVLVGLDAAAREIELERRLLADLDDCDIGLATRANTVGAHPFEIGQAGLRLAKLQREAGHAARYSAEAPAWRQELRPPLRCHKHGTCRSASTP